MADLGALVKQRRLALGLNQQALAARIGVAASNIVSLEHTTSRWHFRSFDNLAAALDIPQIELAIAAGIITDLPSLDGDESAIEAVLFGDPVTQSKVALIEIAQLRQHLGPGELQFLQKVTDQLIRRHYRPDVVQRAEESS